MKIEDIKSIIKEKAKLFKWTALDGYIVKNFFLYLIGSLIFFVIIYELVQFFNEIRYLPKNVDSFGLFLFHFYDGIYWLNIFQPFSFLFATVYVFSRMAHLKELVAIVSTGTSIYRASFYVILSTIIYYLLLIVFIQNSIILPIYQKRWIIWQKVFHGYTDESIKTLKNNERFSIYGANNVIYIVDFYNSLTKELHKITVVKFDSPLTNLNIKKEENINLKQEDFEWLMTNINKIMTEKGLSYPENIKIGLRLDADKAIWDNEKKKWILNYGTLRYVGEKGDSFDIRYFTNETFDFITDPPYYFEKVWYPPDAMTYEENIKYIDKLKKSRYEYRGALANFYSKFTYPLGFVFIILAGIGIIDMSKRKISFIVNLMFSMLLFVIYYLFYAIGVSLADKGDVSPFFGAFAGTFFLGFISTLLFLNTKT